MSNGHGFRLRRLLAVCFAVAFLSACDEKKNAAAPPANPAVGVRLAAMKGVSQSFEFVGHIKATDKVDVRARIEGFLEKIAFREGQDLKAGDLLYQIEKVQFQAQVDQAKANLASAEAEATNAQLQYARQYELSRHQFSPQATVDQNKAALDTGLAKIDIRLRLPNGQEYAHRGVWNLTDPLVDQQTDTLIMRAVMPNPERQLIDGEFVTAIIRERREAPRLVVPQASVQIDQSGR